MECVHRERFHHKFTNIPSQLHDFYRNTDNTKQCTCKIKTKLQASEASNHRFEIPRKTGTMLIQSINIFNVNTGRIGIALSQYKFEFTFKPPVSRSNKYRTIETLFEILC